MNTFLYILGLIVSFCVGFATAVFIGAGKGRGKKKSGSIAYAFFKRGRESKQTITVQSEINLSEHPAWSREDYLERSKELVIRLIGREIYPHLHHFLNDEDSVYIASVEVLVGEPE